MNQELKPVKKHANLQAMSGLLAKKGEPVTPANDAVQRSANGSTNDAVIKSSNDEIVNLSFKIPADFRKQFKLAAIDAGITQNELVQRALALWVSSQKKA